MRAAVLSARPYAVTVRDLDDQTESTYQLVLPVKTDVGRNRISVLAPLAPVAQVVCRLYQAEPFDAPCGH